MAEQETLADKLKRRATAAVGVLTPSGVIGKVANSVNDAVQKSPIGGSPLANVVSAATYPGRLPAQIQKAAVGGVIDAAKWAVSPPAAAPTVKPAVSPGEPMPLPTAPNPFPPAKSPMPAAVAAANPDAPVRGILNAVAPGVLNPQIPVDANRPVYPRQAKPGDPSGLAPLSARPAGVIPPSYAGPTTADTAPQRAAKRAAGFVTMQTPYGTVSVPRDASQIAPSMIRDQDAEGLRGQANGARAAVEVAGENNLPKEAAKAKARVGVFTGLADGLEKSKAGYDAEQAAKKRDAENFTVGSGMNESGAARPDALPAVGVLPRSSAEFNAARANGTAFRTGISGADQRAQDERDGMPKGLTGPERKAWRVGQAKLNQVVDAKIGVLKATGTPLDLKQMETGSAEKIAKMNGEYGLAGKTIAANALQYGADKRYDTAVESAYINMNGRKDVETIRSEANKEMNAWDNVTRERVAGTVTDGRLAAVVALAQSKKATYSSVFNATMKNLDSTSFESTKDQAAEADRITKYLFAQDAKTAPQAGGLAPQAPAASQDKVALARAKISRMLAINPNDPEALRAQANLGK